MKARSRAVNNPLFREGNECISSNLPLSFNVLSSGEGPARSARSLVLDWGNGTFGSPIDGSWDILGAQCLIFVMEVLGGFFVSEIASFEFSQSQIGEFVDTQGNSFIVFFVKSVNFVDIVLEDAESQNVFREVLIFAILLFPLVV